MLNLRTRLLLDLLQKDIILLVQQSLKPSHDAWLNYFELFGEFRPEFLMCGHTFGAGDEL